MRFDNVLVLGAASWNRMVYVDALPQGVSATIVGAREVESVGSTGVGKAMALAALGCAPVLHCTLGRDAHASKVIAACEARGISMMVDVQKAPTPHHLNIMDAHGGRYSLFLEDGGDDPTLDEARVAAAIAQAETIFLSLCPSSQILLPLLEGAEVTVLLDLHDYDGRNPWYDDFIRCADVIQLSNVALRDPKPVIGQLLDGRAAQVVLTKAGEGAEVHTPEGRVDMTPCPALMRDSNGAGDAFSVALWYAQKTGMTVAEAGQFAAAAAAMAVESDDLFPDGVSAADIRRRAFA